ncbi:MAG: hypothetical protein CO141_03445 [Candidatus Moranbacteria bacterium CG_4_9_14_3_um_filter_42_9]|nr:MAG: hypothetical protein CO141_03445 [Candidatus Moranbacteria bacterium CG_4_9_14_3_um_filter_42_9]
MRIAIFTNNYLPNPYGVPGSIESFRKEFEAAGHSVFIFAPKWKGYKDENPNVFRYPAINISYKIKFPLPIPYSRKMDKILEKLDLDIIHAQHPNLLGLEALRWANKKNIPLVFTWHTLYDKYTNFVPLLPKKLSANWIIKKAVKFANKAHLVIVPTGSVVDIIKNWGVENKIISIPTGVEENTFQNYDRQNIREKFEIREDDILLLLISRITEEKNIEFIFDQLTDMFNRNVLLKLMVVGEGYLVPKLKKFSEEKSIASRVIFAGRSGKEDLKNHYAAGDIFVHASKSETQGMILSEAMYMGLPVVAVEATGAKDLVVNNLSGFLVKEDGREFRAAAEKLAGDKELREKMSEAAKKIAREKYTSRVCAEQMLKAYEKTIRENNNR